MFGVREIVLSAVLIGAAAAAVCNEPSLGGREGSQAGRVGPTGSKLGLRQAPVLAQHAPGRPDARIRPTKRLQLRRLPLVRPAIIAAGRADQLVVRGHSR